jgi:Rps23 Pro-64 3,4-dihydroxylase Tpa1-like proline 4-hydroxylase
MQHGNEPFDYWIIDDFLDQDVAKRLSSEFPDYNSSDWLFYDNPIEHKKTIHDWYKFPLETYKFISKLVSKEFVDYISELTGNKKLFADPGLHGGGWHMHGNGGRLNVHMDYSIHPKLKLLRKYNLIVYLSENWEDSWGGNLELWSHDSTTNQPKERKVVVQNKFNRAVLFDASQNSWHGFYDRIACPEGKTRKSIAAYYLTEVPAGASDRPRALFSPAPDQKNDKSVMEFIQSRSK